MGVVLKDIWYNTHKDIRNWYAMRWLKGIWWTMIYGCTMSSTHKNLSVSLNSMTPDRAWVLTHSNYGAEFEFTKLDFWLTLIIKWFLLPCFNCICQSICTSQFISIKQKQMPSSPQKKSQSIMFMLSYCFQQFIELTN